jgi:hypothetical protein
MLAAPARRPKRGGDDWQVPEFQNERLKGKSLEQLIDELGAPVAEPGSVVWETYRAAIDAKIAERQAEIAERQVEASMRHLEAAQQGVGWSRVQGVAVVAATAISLIALLVALL